MAGQQDILREYLISLGFRTDAAANQRFGETITGLDKKATALAKSLIGAATGAAALSVEFAYRMERMYYSSKLAQSTANNLSALDFAGKQAGIKDFTGMVVNLARSVRANPGIAGLISSLGVPVKGRDMSDVALDLVEALNKMPPFLAQRYGQLFGWSADDLYLMRDQAKQIRENAALRKQLAQDLGVDTDKAAEAGRELAQEWRQVLMHVGLFRDAVMIEAVPAMKNLAGVTIQVLNDWTRILQMDRSKFIEDLKVGAGIKSRDQVELSPEARKRLGEVSNDWYQAPAGNKGIGKWLQDFLDYRAKRDAIKRGKSSGADDASVDAATAPDRLAIARERKLAQDQALAKEYNDAINKGDYSKAGGLLQKIDALPDPGGDSAPAPAKPEKTSQDIKERQAQLAALEKKYALPAGTLDYIWKRESSRGKAMLSPAGAKGHFGFMPATAAEYGVAGKENDFDASSDASARKMRDLMKRYSGDARLALAAYNWGNKGVDKLLFEAMEKNPHDSIEQNTQYVLGHAPLETQRYVRDAMGQVQAPSVKVDSTINVHGVENPREVAKQVAGEQAKVYSDVVRNTAPRMQ